MSVEINNLTINYNEEIIFQNTDFEAPKGKITIIRGQSGLGKSSLLNVIALHQNAEYTTFNLLETSVMDINRVQLQNNIVYIFQNPNFIEELTIEENLKVSVSISTVKDGNTQIINALQQVGVENLKNCYPRELSGGELQRLEIARVILQDSPIILADEVTSALDEENKIRVLQILEELARKGKTIIIATHDNVVEQYSDYCYVIENKTLKLYDSNVKTHKKVPLKSSQNSEFLVLKQGSDCLKDRWKKCFQYVTLRLSNQKILRTIVMKALLLVCFLISISFGHFYQKNQIEYYSSHFDRNIVVEDLRGVSTSNSNLSFKINNNAIGFSEDDIAYFKNITGVEDVDPVFIGQVINFLQVNKGTSNLKDGQTLSMPIPLISTTSTGLDGVEITAFLANTFHLVIGDIIEVRAQFYEGTNIYEKKLQLPVTNIYQSNTILGVENQHGVIINSRHFSQYVEKNRSPYMNIRCVNPIVLNEITEHIKLKYPVINTDYDSTGLRLYNNDYLIVKIIDIAAIVFILVFLLYEIYSKIQHFIFRNRKEFCILRSWGMQKQDIVFVVLLEALINFILISVLFLIISFLIIWLVLGKINYLMEQMLFICLIFGIFEIGVQIIILLLLLKDNILEDIKTFEKQFR